MEDGTLPDRIESLVTPDELARSMRDGVPPKDRCFDQYLPADLREVSARHWTPLRVVIRAAEWLRELEVRTVVDIGSGAGKFCVAAALAGDCTFTGLERRSRLVTAARQLASTFRVQDRVRFLEATFGECEDPHADAYYLFNPFAENLFSLTDRIDHDVDLGLKRHAFDIAATSDFLRRVPAGTFVLTYHGFGDQVPATYEVVCVDRSFSGLLQMWRKKGKQLPLTTG